MRFSLLVLLAAGLAGCGGSDAPAPPTSDVPSEPSATATVASPSTPDLPGNPTPEAASDTLTVVFFGDSLTAGYGLANPDETAYPALLAGKMDASGVPARVVNAGLSGETSAGGLRRVDWILSRNTPDVFMLALGANDMLRGQPPAETEKNLRATLDKVREVAPEARLVVAGLEALPNLGAAYGDAYRQVFRDVAADYDAAFLPFLLDGVAGDPALNQQDGVHPTARGHQIMAATVWETLQPVVSEAASGARS